MLLSTPTDHMDEYFNEAEVLGLAVAAGPNERDAADLLDLIQRVEADTEIPERLEADIIDVFCEFSGWDIGETADLLYDLELAPRRSLPALPPASQDTDKGTVLLRVSREEGGTCAACRNTADGWRIETQDGVLVLCNRHVGDVSKAAGYVWKEGQARFTVPKRVEIIHTREGSFPWVDGNLTRDPMLDITVYETVPPEDFDPGQWAAVSEAIRLQASHEVGPVVVALREAEAEKKGN